jgi:hypothetical protein
MRAFCGAEGVAISKEIGFANTIRKPKGFQTEIGFANTFSNPTGWRTD